MAAAESLVYVKGGDIHVLDARGDRAITSDGAWEAPSQADDGTIFAVRKSSGSAGHTNRAIVRLDHTGRSIGPVLHPVTPDSSQNGPFDLKAAPDGKHVAYWLLRPTISDGPVAGMTATDRDDPEHSYLLTGHWKPFWLDSATFAMFDTQHYPRALTYTVGDAQSTPWFGDDPSSRVSAGDRSRDGRLLATVEVDEGRLVVSTLAGPPPGTPTAVCEFRGAAGSFQSPTWSPDGQRLAWAEDDGIHVATIRDLGTCDLPASVLVPGGRQPDFGPADAGPAGVGGPAPAAKVSATVAARATRAQISRGLAVTVRCPAACKASARLLVGSRTVARASTQLTRAGKRVLRLRARIPKGVRKVSVRVMIGSARDAATVTITG